MLLISTLPYNNTAKAIDKREIGEIVKPIFLGFGIVGIFMIVYEYFIGAPDRARCEGLEQAQILERFRDTNNYRNLQIDSCQMYSRFGNKYYWESGDESIRKFTVVWLEKSARLNVNWIPYNDPVRKRLEAALYYLRGDKRFMNEKRLYDEAVKREKARQENFAMEREKINLKKERLEIERERLELEKSKMVSKG